MLLLLLACCIHSSPTRTCAGKAKHIGLAADELYWRGNLKNPC